MIEVFSFNKATNQIIKDKINAPRLKWIRIVDPDKEKIKTLSENTNIPVEEFEETFQEEERPKVVQRGYVEIIYRAPSLVDDELETQPVYFYLFEKKLVTIEKKRSAIFDSISDSFSKNDRKFLFRRGLPYFIYYVIDKINDEFLLRIDKIAARVDIYENFSKKEMSVQDIEKLYDQSVTLSFFNQALIANVEVLNSLKKGYYKPIPRKDVALLEELYFDVLQVLDTEKSQSAVITNLINVHSVLTSTRLNEFMKRLTILAIIVTIPTILSGIYGMNFSYIPLQDHPHGFYITSVGIIFVTFVIYYLFTKK